MEKEPNRRKKDKLLYSIMSVFLFVVCGTFGWIGKNVSYIIDNFPVMMYRLQDMDESSKEMKKNVEENTKLLQELKTNQDVIKKRQTKVIDTLRLLMKMHRMPDCLPFEGTSQAAKIDKS